MFNILFAWSCSIWSISWNPSHVGSAATCLRVIFDLNYISKGTLVLRVYLCPELGKCFSTALYHSMTVHKNHIQSRRNTWGRAISIYPMTHILGESEATITRGIWSHIHARQKGGGSSGSVEPPQMAYIPWEKLISMSCLWVSLMVYMPYPTPPSWYK